MHVAANRKQLGIPRVYPFNQNRRILFYQAIRCRRAFQEAGNSMTTSQELIVRARRLAMAGPDAGSDLSRVTLEIAGEYEIAMRWMLEKEELIHRATKLLEAIN